MAFYLKKFVNHGAELGIPSKVWESQVVNITESDMDERHRVLDSRVLCRYRPQQFSVGEDS